MEFSFGKACTRAFLPQELCASAPPRDPSEIMLVSVQGTPLPDISRGDAETRGRITMGAWSFLLGRRARGHSCPKNSAPPRLRVIHPKSCWSACRGRHFRTFHAETRRRGDGSPWGHGVFFWEGVHAGIPAPRTLRLRASA